MGLLRNQHQTSFGGSMFKLLPGLYWKLDHILLMGKSKQRLVKGEENQVAFISKMQYTIMFHSFWPVQFKGQPRIGYYIFKGRMRVLAHFAPFSKWTARFCGWTSHVARARKCLLLCLLLARSDWWLPHFIPIFPPLSPHPPLTCARPRWHRVLSKTVLDSSLIKETPGNPE